MPDIDKQQPDIVAIEIEGGSFALGVNITQGRVLFRFQVGALMPIFEMTPDEARQFAAGLVEAAAEAEAVTARGPVH